MVHMAQKTSVLITSVGGVGAGYQVLESLKTVREKYRITVADMNPFSQGLYEADAAYLLPSAKRKDYIDKLIEIAKKEKVKIILFGHESEIKVAAKNQQKILAAGIIPVVSSQEVTENSLNKLNLSKFLTKNNILTPQTILLDTPEKANRMEFPIVIKPSKDSSGSRNCYIVKDMKELKKLFKELEGIEMLAQEYVGSETEEYTVGILIAPNGDIIDSIVMRRYLDGITRGLERKIDGKTYVLSTGYTQGFFVDQPEVKAYCEHVAKVVGARGPLNLQCRRGKKGVYIFEVHPRFSGSASQRTAVGFNEPDAIIRSFVHGEKITSVPHKLNYAVIRKFANTIIPIKEFEKMKSQKI